MKSLKPTARRLLMLAPVLSLLAVTYSCQEKPQETVYVTTQTSRAFELPACADSILTEPLCDQLMVMKEEDCPYPTFCFERLLTSSVDPPDPCPIGHCIPFLMIPRVCFYSEADTRPVEIFVNDKLIGKASDVSYDAKQKLRTVYFDGRQSFKNSSGNGQNVLRLRIPVTYVKSGQELRTILDARSQF